MKQVGRMFFTLNVDIFLSQTNEQYHYEFFWKKGNKEKTQRKKE